MVGDDDKMLLGVMTFIVLALVIGASSAGSFGMMIEAEAIVGLL